MLLRKNAKKIFQTKYEILIGRLEEKIKRTGERSVLLLLINASTHERNKLRRDIDTRVRERFAARFVSGYGYVVQKRHYKLSSHFVRRGCSMQ